MKVQQIQTNQNFTAAPKPMSKNMKNSVKNILIKMNYGVKQSQRGDHYETVFIKKIYHGEDISFEDERRLRNVVPSSSQMQGFSSLRMGDSYMDFDNETREIVDYSKPFYMPWFLFIKKAEKALQKLKKYFNDNSVVSKECLAVRDLTPEGMERMRKYVLQVEKQRLERIIKELE